MQHIKDALREWGYSGEPEPDLTRQARRRIEAAEVARLAVEASHPELAFHARPFVLCGLPVRRPPASQVRYTRKNGKFTLDVVAHPDYGLPFGQDRLVPLWVATQAVKQRDRTIRFRSAGAILRDLDGPHYRRLLDGFRRIFASTIYFGTDPHSTPARIWDVERFHFFDRLRLWRKPGASVQDGDPPNLITLSETFWREIQEHPIPIKANVVRALLNNAGALDLYIWLSWRCFTAKGPESIPLFGPNGLVRQLGIQGYARDRSFRKRLRAWLGLVHLYWPNCPASVCNEAQYMNIRSPAFDALPVTQRALRQ